MLLMLLFLALIYMLLFRFLALILSLLSKIKINRLINTVNSTEDLLYLHHKDFINVICEVFRRKGHQVNRTDQCGEEGNGIILNDIQFAEVWKHSLNKKVEIEAGMKMTTHMERSHIYRGMLVTLGDFKPSTKLFCHKNVITCVNGEQLIFMLKEVQKRKEILQTNHQN